MNPINGAAKEEIEALKSELRDVHSRIKRLAKTVDPEVREELKAYVEEAGENIREHWLTAKEGAKETGQKVQDYAKENPWHIAAAGLAVGMVIAALVKQDKDK